MEDLKTCSIEGCDRQAYARGWCRMHYQRWRKHGDPTVSAHRPRGMSLEESLAWFLPEPIRTERGCLTGWVGNRAGSRGLRPQLTYGNTNRTAAAWVCELTHGPKPEADFEAAHECNNGECLEPTHIVWKTRLENELDKLTIERAWHRLEDELGGSTAVLIAAVQRYGEAA